MWVTSNSVSYSRRNPKRSAQCVYHTGISVYSTARAGISCIKKTGVNRKFVKYTMDLLSVPEYVIKKGRPHGHRYGKKPGDKEYHTANQLKRKSKKKHFQGIHDRFIRHSEFRNRMIENHRDEDLCRRWDALADEDHTHHLTAQEYLYCKSKWWLHSNKQGSNTMPLRHRPDFQASIVYLATIATRSRRRTTGAYLLLQTPTMGGTQFIFYMVELARFMVDSLSFRKSRRRCTKYCVNGATCCLQYLENSSEKDFHELNLFCYRLIVYS